MFFLTSMVKIVVLCFFFLPSKDIPFVPIPFISNRTSPTFTPPFSAGPPGVKEWTITYGFFIVTLLDGNAF